MSWNNGYVSEIPYTYGYYQELSPLTMEQALVFKRLRLAKKPLKYLELGYGQGLSLAVHAATTEGEFWGTDFIPEHTRTLSTLAEASGSQIHALNDSFEELLQRTDLPQFDIISMHGIWSWISDKNREAIVTLVSRKLAVGGILFISYNCLPGWSAGMPLRNLFTLHAERSGNKAEGMVKRVNDALDFAAELEKCGAL